MRATLPSHVPRFMAQMVERKAFGVHDVLTTPAATRDPSRIQQRRPAQIPWLCDPRMKPQIIETLGSEALRLKAFRMADMPDCSLQKNSTTHMTMRDHSASYPAEGNAVELLSSSKLTHRPWASLA
jgi:hypothetical protein